LSLFGPPNIKDLKAKGNVQGLIKALSYQKDAHIRELASTALGELRNVLAVDPLATALRDSSEEVRKAAASSLGTIGDGRAVGPLAAALRDSSEDVRKAAASSLGTIGDGRAIEPLFQALKGKSRSYVAEAIKRFRDVHTKELAIAALKVGDLDVRYWAIEILEQIGDRSAVEPLIAAGVQANPYPSVEGHAENVLKKICDVNCIEPLVNTLKDKAPKARGIAAYLLGRIGDARAVDPLIAALKDESQFVRIIVVRALNSLGWKPDKDENGAYYWATIMNWDECIAIGAPAVEPLLKLFAGSSESDRLLIVDKLVRLGWQPDRSEMGAYYWSSKHQWDKCIEIGKPAIAPLIYAVDDERGLPFRQRFLIARALTDHFDTRFTK
jgi:HEAT repeat protein